MPVRINELFVLLTLFSSHIRDKTPTDLLRIANTVFFLQILDLPTWMDVGLMIGVGSAAAFPNIPRLGAQGDAAIDVQDSSA